MAVDRILDEFKRLSVLKDLRGLIIAVFVRESVRFN